MTLTPLIGPTTSPDLHVMSFNVRRAMDGPLHRRRDRWSTRAPAVFELLRSERPTVIGLQEALPRAVGVVRDALGPHARVLGHGRSRAGRGEGNPIVYDTARLELQAWGQHALSAHPHEPGSRTWGNLIPRILVWAQFSQERPDSRFLVVNTHLDHLSARSRRHSADALIEIVQRHGLPAVVMGDLNAGHDSREVLALTSGGVLVDTWDVADDRLTPHWGTYPGYRRARSGGRRIDRLLVTPEVAVHAAAINERTFDGVRPSDHLAVQGVVRIREEIA